MEKFPVIKIEFKTKNTFCLRVGKPNRLIKSGQCFNVGIPGSQINREYSIYSPVDAPYLEFLIRAVDDGLLSCQLQNMKVGDLVEIDGPFGEFCIPEKKINSKFVFIASGTGIAPFHSFVKTYPKLNYSVIHGIRFASETYDNNDYHSGKYIACISQNQNGVSMRVTDYLILNKVTHDSIIYLCGNRNMIIDSVQILLDQGISGDQIISEVFF